MGFFGLGEQKKEKKPIGPSVDFFHRNECKVCPLDKIRGNLHPHMKPTGSLHPKVYICGEVPGETEDKIGKHFVGTIGKMLRECIPDGWLKDIRWNNIVRTRPRNNATPSWEAIECFPSGTMVQPIGRIKTLYRRWYNGALLLAKTASGRVLSGTPNHPIFTSDGKTAFKDIKVGDNLFCASNSYLRSESARSPNINNKPAPIDQIFSSFFEPSKMKRMAMSPLDFHGDGITNSNVDIINADSLLMNDIEMSTFEQKLSDFNFTFHDELNILFTHSCQFDCMRTRHFPPTESISNFESGVSFTPNTSTFRGIPESDMLELPNEFPDCMLTNSLSSTNLLHTFSRDISCDNISLRLPNFAGNPPLFGRRSNCNSSINQTSPDCAEIAACQLNDKVNTFSRRIDFDQVISIEQIRFSGHVYNLETESNKYVANGIIVSNCCRPSIIRDIEMSKPKIVMGFGNIPLDWAIKRTGITLWTGRKIPIRVGNHACWFFPSMHPSFIAHTQDEREKQDLHFAFSLHANQAFAQIDDLPPPVIHSNEDARKGVEIITGNSSDDFNKVISFIRSLYDCKVVGLDYETKGVRPYANNARILTLGLSSKDETKSFPFDHPQSGFTDKHKKLIKQEYEDFLYKAECRKISHHLPFEMEWTAYFFGNKSLRAQPWGDSLSQSYVIDERPKTHDLDFLCLQYFGIHLKQISNLDKERLDQESLEDVLTYNGIDSKYHRLLYLAQLNELRRLGLLELYQHQLRRIPTMVLTQLKGVPVDAEAVKRLDRKYSDILRSIEKELVGLPQVQKFKRKYSYDFRPSAPKDIIKLLEDEKIHVQKADEENLKRLNHPVATLVLEWRGVNKMLSTYVTPLKKDSETSCLHDDGMLHPIISTTTTRTWRTSSKDPNSQNFSKHDDKEEPIEVKYGIKKKDVRAQVKHKFKKIVAFDFAGIQARNVAQESKDKALVSAFWDNYDIHASWAKRAAELHRPWVIEGMKLFNSDKSVFTKYRQISKNKFVFPSFFGAYPKSISGGMEIPERIAQRLQDEFWEEFPDIHKWQNKLKESYYETGYVTGLSGFRRHAPISSNQVINSSIQADESIIVCSAMAALSEMEDERYQANLEVHDDLSFFWDKDEIDKNAEVVAKEMTRLRFPWMKIVPVVIEMSIGDDWSSLKEVAKFSSIEIWNHRRNHL